MKNIPGNILLVLVLFVLAAAGCNDGSTNPPVDEVKITQITNYPAGIGMVTAAHDGSFIVYTVRNDTVTEVRTCDIYGGNEKLINSFPALYNMLLSKDDSKILFVLFQNGNQLVYHLQDLNTGSIELINFDQSQPSYYAVEFANDNSKILLGSEHIYIYILDFETKMVTRVLDENAYPIKVSPSGNEILFRDQYSNLCKVNIDGSSRMTLVSEYEFYNVLFSPDGNQIYFTGKKGQDFIKPSVWKMNANGSNMTMAAGGKDHYHLSGISHDGKTILLYSYPDYSNNRNSDIVIKTASYEKKLFESETNDTGLSFTNQPGKILFLRHNVSISNLYLVEFPVAWLNGYAP